MRASKTLNGPTIVGMSPNGDPAPPPKPNAARLICCRVSPTRALMFGSSSRRGRAAPPARRSEETRQVVDDCSYRNRQEYYGLNVNVRAFIIAPVMRRL